jgi:hypothetical protein
MRTKKSFCYSPPFLLKTEVRSGKPANSALSYKPQGGKLYNKRNFAILKSILTQQTSPVQLLP